ncbi:ABC transporter ATP-binding protein [Halomicroarcula sp. S1AR25-4]|uniref:ABC transporter ATP-binding protein n=1 Tax=Haloarcula sp. S1AR25-4 TaxID=2950538 RepID=UPI00287468F7|nr:ABC transporter ATP-binding protein [Halomicroarcula sp. S1AR25-4]MDS0279772.1 ABC transporter ATP-binding protein [Halomicroarcula sp. S1AR25-4]
MTSRQTYSQQNAANQSQETDLAIDAQNVTVTYEDGTEAVRGVSLRIEKGEFFGFLGPNGAGKTTTIKSLVTLLHPTEGSVRINGYDTVTEPEKVRHSIGYMAQETSIDRELTPRENLQLACKLYGVPVDQREDRIEALLDLVDLQDVADTRSEKFSGGMKKRLDAASVLVHRPPVVFLDEPTTGLDPEARLRLWNYFERINEQGTTVFLTTQYLEEADQLCDRLSLLQDGQIIATGSPGTLKSEFGTDIFEITLENPVEERIERAVQAVRRIGTLDEPTIRTTEDGFTVRSARAREAASDLFAALDGTGVSVSDFDVRSPTLDDVFLALTDGSSDTAGRADTGMASLSAQEVST